MANQRLINCDFFVKGAFDTTLSNKAKFLFFNLIVNADDCGFVGNLASIIENLNKDNTKDTNALVDYTYDNAVDELLEKGFVYRFVDKHHNVTLLIRSWFLHNKYNPRYSTTNFISYRAKVELHDGQYVMKEEKPFKEKEIKQTNNANNTNKNLNDPSSHNEPNNEDNNWKKEWDEITNELNEKGGCW